MFERLSFPKTLCFVAIASLATPALADDVTDTLESAMSAYQDGDIAYALEELDYARQLLLEMNTQQLSTFLPEAPAGWTRTISEENMGAGLAFLGGGTGAEAEYSNGEATVTIRIIADSPMAAMIGGMVSNAAMMGMKLHRVGRVKFVDSDGDLSALIDNRILVQAEGADPEVMIPLLELIDYKALADFGK